MKRKIAVLLLVCAFTCACGKKDEAPQTVEKIPAQEEAVVEEQDPRDQFKEAFGLSCLFSCSVRNDKTGKWRILTYSAGKDFTPYAADYYAAYFESDDEVHAVVDLKHGTYMITCSGGQLFIDLHAYVDGEEHDAQLLGSGDLISQYVVDLSTGKVEKL